MANGNKNIFMAHLSGSIGDQVTLRQRARTTVVGRKIGPYQREPTEEQAVARDNFKAAIMYAKGAIQQADLKALYQRVAKDGQSAYNVAFLDAYIPARIKEIKDVNYNGTVGSTLGVIVMNVVDVPAVKFSIVKADGTLVESGDAVYNAIRSIWNYTATALNDEVSGSVVEITVVDLANNVTTEVFELA